MRQDGDRKIRRRLVCLPAEGSGCASLSERVEPPLGLSDPLAEGQGLLPRDQTQAVGDAREETPRLLGRTSRPGKTFRPSASVPEGSESVVG